jgi:hypothetical protein
MKRIIVPKAFIYLEPNVRKEFEPGIHEVEDRVADHYWVKAHSKVLEDPAPAPAEVPKVAPVQQEQPKLAETETAKVETTEGNAPPQKGASVARKS